MKRMLKEIEPVSLGKMLGLLYGICGPIAFLIILIMSIFAPDDSPGIFVAFAALIGFPLGGFLTGLLLAVLYNIAARFVGGIKVDIESE